MMFRCLNDNCGGITYLCGCGSIKFIPFRCHGRICPRCGKRYAEKWGRGLMDRFLSVPHRHVIFTLPRILWDVVKSNPGTLVNDMFEAAKTVILRLFNDRFKSLSVKPGIICLVHYTGRDMKYNPHLHMLVTEGGLTSKGLWKKHSFWPYSKMCAYWKYEVLKWFRFHMRHSLDVKAIIDHQQKQRFKDQTSGYVVKNYRDVVNVKDLGGYLARYVRHPPIGESRILAFDGEHIKIKYEWDNQMHLASIEIDDFIAALLSNIPPKGFKTVRQYGLYSNTLYLWACIKLTAAKYIPTTLDRYIPDLFKEEVICPNCKGVMKPIVMDYLCHGRWQTKFL